MEPTNKKAIIIGADAAGLTAAYELLKHTDIIPVVLEKSGEIGGTHKIINYKRTHMDMDEHCFFSENERVKQWWLNILSLQKGDELLTTFSSGHLWEEVVRQIQEMGGGIYMHHDVKHMHNSDSHVTAITAVNEETGEELQFEGDFFFSTIPVKELIGGISGEIPANEYFDTVRANADQLENLFLIGRNGMHKYNNADHSILAAILAVDNIAAGITSKENIWAINTEQEYREEKSMDDIPAKVASVPLTFKDFLLHTKSNKVFLCIAGVAILLQFIIFKYLYFTPGFVDGDSYVYLRAAYYNFNINTYPIGYSRFLRIFSTFTKSHIALVGFQYLLLQGSSLFFIFTLTWLYKPRKVVFAILFCCMVFNPVFLYMSNYVTSDALFLGLSLIWFTLLLWIIHRPAPKLIIIHAIIILLAFTVRYNALFYPIVGAIAFILSKQSIRMKIAGIVASVLLIAGFIFHTSNQYNKLTGIRQFSPFSGWQMANNALYTYRFLQDTKPVNLPPRFRQLDQKIRTYFDTTRNLYAHSQEMLIANTWYMWDPKSPLQIYMNNQFKNDSKAGPLKRWATMGPLYTDYGSYLIKQNPAAFTVYFILPNLLKYYAPPVEFLETYNMGKDSIQPIAQTWFRLKSAKVKTHFKDLKVTILGFYPVLVGILNVVFLFGLIGFTILKGFKKQKLLAGGLLLVFGLWLVNFVFSVFVSQIALRFQMLPILVFMSFAVLLIEYVWKEAFTEVKK